MPSNGHQDLTPSHSQQRAAGSARAGESAALRPLGYLVPLGRSLYALIFLLSTPLHFSSQGVSYAAQAGVPAPQVLVPAAGVLCVVGALSVLLGYYARIGALLLMAFLVPVTLAMHAFWSVKDPAAAQLQQIMFLKNLSLFGAALLLSYFGAGPISVDEHRRNKRRHLELVPLVTGVFM